MLGQCVAYAAAVFVIFTTILLYKTGFYAFKNSGWGSHAQNEELGKPFPHHLIITLNVTVPVSSPDL